MPIKRFADTLMKLGQYEEYMQLLVNSFNPKTVEHLMCRDQVSISWDGYIYDCDFNQMLELEIGAELRGNKKSLSIWDVENLHDLTGQKIATKKHCFGCTAGAGSSCGGSLV